MLVPVTKSYLLGNSPQVGMMAASPANKEHKHRKDGYDCAPACRGAVEVDQEATVPHFPKKSILQGLGFRLSRSIIKAQQLLLQLFLSYKW